MHQKLKNI